MEIKQILSMAILLSTIFLVACKDNNAVHKHNSVQSDEQVVFHKLSQAEITQLTKEFDRLKSSLKLPVMIGDSMRIDDMKIDLVSENPTLSFDYSMLNVSVDSVTGQTFKETAQVLKSDQLKYLCADPKMVIFKEHHLPIVYCFSDKNGQQLMRYTLNLSRDC